MNNSRKKRSDIYSSVLVALLVTVLVHMVVVMVVGTVWNFTFKNEEKKTEVVMLEMKPPPEPGPVVPPPPVPAPLPIPEPVIKPPKPISPVPQPVASVPENAPPLMSTEPPVTPEPLASDVNTSELSQEELSRVNLDVNWNNFSRTFGQEASQARETHMETSLAKRRQVGTFSGMSAKVKKAIETNRGWARPGNQEPLGNRRKIFYSYIKRIHEERIHPIFGHGFWESLSALGSANELNDMSLHTLTEFEILENGAVNEVRVVRTSGSMVFDAAAIDSVYRGSPFPPPPKEILSWNGRVYLKWGFYRSQRMCGVFNVEPYILKAPGSGKEKIQIDDFINGSDPPS